MGAACPVLVAAADSLADPKFIRILAATGLLAGALLAGAIVVAFVDRWRKRRANETLATHDQLASFRLLYERGELSKEEFERIKAQLLARLKATENATAAKVDVANEADVSPPPAAGGNEPTQPTDSPPQTPPT